MKENHLIYKPVCGSSMLLNVTSRLMSRLLQAVYHCRMVLRIWSVRQIKRRSDGPVVRALRRQSPGCGFDSNSCLSFCGMFYEGIAARPFVS